MKNGIIGIAFMAMMAFVLSAMQPKQHKQAAFQQYINRCRRELASEKEGLSTELPATVIIAKARIAQEEAYTDSLSALDSLDSYDLDKLTGK